MQTFEEAYENDNQEFSVFIGDKEYRGFYANDRISEKTLRSGWYMYDLRATEDDEERFFGEIKNGRILVNYLGTFCTPNELPIDKGESLFDDEFDYSFY